MFERYWNHNSGVQICCLVTIASMTLSDHDYEGCSKSRTQVSRNARNETVDRSLICGACYSLFTGDLGIPLPGRLDHVEILKYHGFVC